MNRTLIKEELNRIRELMGFLIETEQKFDDPAKADFVEKDLEKFYKNLEDAIDVPEGLKQQPYKNYSYQKTVETMQIGLTLLGYELPRFGVDGKYGPETAAAVKKFKDDNKEAVEKIRESKINKKFANKSFISETLELITLKDLENNYNYVNSDQDGTVNDQVSKSLLDDIELAAKRAGVRPKIHFAQHGHPDINNPNNNSRHKRNIAVDIGSIDGEMGDTRNGRARKFKALGDKLKDELVKLGYNWNAERGHQKAVLWQTFVGGNHYNHLHISNNEGEEGHVPVLPSGDISGPGSVMEPVYLKQMLVLLKTKNINVEDIKRFIDLEIGLNEKSSSGTIIFIGGLVKNMSTENQTKVLERGLPSGLKVMSFGFNNSANIKSYVQNNPGSIIICFSKGCEAAPYLTKIKGVDPRKIFMIEPYHANGANKGLGNLGIPEKNFFVGPHAGRGKGIVANPSNSNGKDHFDALATSARQIFP